MKVATTILLLIAALLAALLFARDFSPRLRAGTDLVNWRDLPSIPLLDDAGKPTTLAASDGRMRLVFYGFVRCPDVCPATLSKLKQLYERLSDEQKAKVHVQFISVDPQFDRPNLIREYLDKFNADFTGLTSLDKSPESLVTIDKVAKEMFVGIQRPLPSQMSGQVDHSAHLATDSKDSDSTSDSVANGTSNDTNNVSTNNDQNTAAALLHGDQVSVVNTKGQFVRVYNNAEVIQGALTKDLPVLLKKYGP